MAPIFTIKINGDHIKDVETTAEIVEELASWVEIAYRGDTFTIECELEA